MDMPHRQRHAGAENAGAENIIAREPKPMKLRPSSNPLNVDAPRTSPRVAPAPTAHDLPPGSAAPIPAAPSSSSFADDTRHDDTRHDGASDEDQMTGGTVKTSRNGALWLLLSLLAFYGVFSLGAWSQKRSSKPPVIGPFASRAKTGEAKVVVHVAGAVRRPGVYTLSNNARVFEALHLAGGALPQASTDTLNLADWAQDGARIEVPFKTNLRASTNAANSKAAPQIVANTKTSAISNDTAAPDEPSIETSQDDVAQNQTTQNDVTQNTSAQSETAAPTPTPTQSSTRLPRTTIAKTAQTRKTEKPRRSKAASKSQSKTIAGLPRALTPDGKLSDNASPQYLQKHPLDLNKIAREQLEALPGVGPSLAQKILDYRAQNGGFKNVDELDNVSGIGEKKLAALKPLLYVVGAPSAASQPPATSP